MTRTTRSMRPRRLTLAALAVTTALVAACGGDGGDSTAEGGSAAGGTDTPITLTVWDWQYEPGSNPFGDAQQQLDEEFMAANPDITIKHEFYPYGDFFTLIQTAITAKEGPDVFMMYGGSFGADYTNGLEPLDDYLTDEQRDQLLYLADATTGGTQYVVPWTTYTTRLLYNKELYTKAGLDPEAPPETWEEFLAANDALREIGVDPIAAGFQDGYYGEWMMYALTSQTLTDEEFQQNLRGELDWTSPAVTTAVERMVELAERGDFADDFESFLATPDTIDQFAAGTAAHVLSQETSNVTVEEKIGAENLGVMRMPMIPESQVDEPFLAATYNLGLSIGTWSPNKDAAWEYISFLLSAESQEVAFDVGGYFPNNSDSEVSSDSPSQQQILDWVATDPNIRFGIGFRAEEGKIFDSSIAQVLNGEKTVADLLGEIEATRQRLGPVEG